MSVSEGVMKRLSFFSSQALFVLRRWRRRRPLICGFPPSRLAAQRVRAAACFGDVSTAFVAHRARRVRECVAFR